MDRTKASVRFMQGIAGAALVLALLATASVAQGANSSPHRSSATGFPRTAGGDIPDTATYLRYKNRLYSIEYVEGWVQTRLTHDAVRMSDIDSFVRVSVGPRPSGSLMTYVRAAGLRATKHDYRQVTGTSVTSVTLHVGASVRLSFRALSAPNPVTGKQVTLIIDRYYVPGKTRMARIDLATPVGVDNIDAFRRIAQSFTWLHA